jgi:hypothetical protein
LLKCNNSGIEKRKLWPPNGHNLNVFYVRAEYAFPDNDPRRASLLRHLKFFSRPAARRVRPSAPRSPPRGRHRVTKRILALEHRISLCFSGLAMALSVGSLLARCLTIDRIGPLRRERLAAALALMLNTGSRMPAAITGVVNRLPTFDPADEMPRPFADRAISKNRARAMVAWSRRKPFRRRDTLAFLGDLAIAAHHLVANVHVYEEAIDRLALLQLSLARLALHGVTVAKVGRFGAFS